MPAPSEHQDLAAFTRRVMIVLLLAGLAVAAWQLARLLVLAAGGLLLAVVLRRISGGIARHTPLSHRWALVATLILAALLIAGGGWLVGHQLASQFQELGRTLSQGVDRIRELLDGTGMGDLLPGAAGESGARSASGGGFGLAADGIVGRIVGTTSVILEALAGALIVLFIGIYTAAAPDLYRRGVLLLIPKNRRAQGEQVLDDIGESLWRWMLGQFLSMLIIGVLTTVALYLLGVPMALALGLLAGLLEFIPILGPWIAAVPAVLVALTLGFDTALWVALAYFGIQQVESYLITPLAERWAVALPPALTVAAAMGFTLLFGFVGLLFATPIAVALTVMVRRLYVRDTLGARPGSSRMPG